MLLMAPLPMRGSGSRRECPRAVMRPGPPTERPQYRHQGDSHDTEVRDHGRVGRIHQRLRGTSRGRPSHLKALPGAKISLQQGITQVAKGNEVATEAKYEMDKGKLALTVYTSSKGFDTPAEDNAFNEYGGDATAAAWKPEKEVFADLKHIARSAQYHTLLSMTKMTIPAIIQKASALGTVFSVKEKIRNGKPVFEVMTAQGGTAKTTYYDLVSGEVAAGL